MCKEIKSFNWICQSHLDWARGGNTSECECDKFKPSGISIADTPFKVKIIQHFHFFNICQFLQQKSLKTSIYDNPIFTMVPTFERNMSHYENKKCIIFKGKLWFRMLRCGCGSFLMKNVSSWKQREEKWGCRRQCAEESLWHDNICLGGKLFHPSVTYPDYIQTLWN